jgi:hypothetical protein
MKIEVEVGKEQPEVEEWSKGLAKQLPQGASTSLTHLYSDRTLYRRHPRTSPHNTDKMVQMYTVAGRQVGSHVVSIHQSSPIYDAD